MKVLLTGASSFTGYWFAKSLSDAGFVVTAPLRGKLGDYNEGPRAERVARLASCAKIVEDTAFGSERFIEMLRTEGFDLLCHHASQVTDYRSANFNVAQALGENTHNLRAVLDALKANGLKSLVLTGSVFEQGEGAGTQPLHAFSAYGLSKGFTSAYVEHCCREKGIGFGKFVIPNPFGPLEEPRFTAYLMRCWKKGEVALVNTPLYVRDNIHVSLLATAYVKFCRKVWQGGLGSLKLNPSGYVESQGAFALRFAKEIRNRTRMACEVQLGIQTDFSEPLVRINFDNFAENVNSEIEKLCWDRIVELN